MRPRFFHPWVVSVFILLGSGVLTGCHLLTPTPSATIPANARPDFRLMAEAWNTIERVYVDRAAVKPEQMTYGAISGMVDSLGDTAHSRFLTPEMVKQERDMTRGELEGIGAELQVKNSQVVIVTPLDDSPAEKAGLKPGDIILKVNGEDVGGLPLEQVVPRILGPPGTSVRLTILNPKSGRTSEVTIIRARVIIRSVTWHRLPGTTVAHLRIATFSKGVTADLRKALKEIEQDRASGLILDLRNNPGGLFNEAVSTASQFLATGNVVLEKNALGKITPVPVEHGGLALTLPLVALINGGTASAAEIVAGALQDGHRAILVGEKTFGTGTVLQEFPLTDGSALLLATEEWLTPSGQVIWHRGITANVEVSLPPDVTPLIPKREKEMTAQGLQASGDAQLLKALDLLVHRERKQSCSEASSEVNSFIFNGLIKYNRRTEWTSRAMSISPSFTRLRFCGMRPCQSPLTNS
jgi:carboxyl-terminal processing protease